MKNNTCQNVIKERRSTRAFENCEISKAEILEILEAARLAPSAKNRQPWSFYVLENEEKEFAVNKLVEALKKNNTEATGLASANIMTQADKVVLVFMDRVFEERKVVDLLSVGAAIENMLLRATEMDIQSLWMYDICVIADELEKLAGTDKMLVSGVCFGKGDTSSKRAVKKDLNSIILNKNWKE